MKSVKVEDADVLRREAAIFSAYLINKAPREDAVGLYVTALQNRPGALSDTDKKRLAFVRKHPGLLRFIDPGLALVNPSSEVRRRIYIMFSILESMPYYHDSFLPKNRSRWYFLTICVRAGWGLIKTAFGALLVKVIA